MSETIKLAAFCGSLRKASFNRLALKAFAERLPPGTTLSTIEIGDWPLYDADVQAQGFPVGVQAAQKAMLEADGIVFATPEYNYSVSGVLKNAIDWATRPTDGEGMVALSAFRGKVAGLLGASLSPFGGLRGVTHLRQILGTIQTVVATEQVLVPAAHAAFDDAGALKDALPAQLLGGLAARVIELAERLEPPIA